MSKGIREVLCAHSSALSALYTDSLEAVQELQWILISQILPGLVDELQLDEETQRCCLEWLEDTQTIFRTLRRHRFINSFALEALRDTLVWRARALRYLIAQPPSPYLHCLPTGVHDPFDHPIIILNLAPLCGSTSDIKASFVHNVELLRLHLLHLNGPKRTGLRPILQYVALLDIGGVSFHNVQQNIELLNWFVHELLPRFPGMLGAVFVLNYSWAHTGIWNLAKRLLPVTALERVFFPSRNELKEYFSPQSLPKDLGGDLPPLSSVGNPLRRYVAVCPTPSTSQGRPDALIPDRKDTQTSQAPQRKALSATSLVNPYYGYPVVYNSHFAPTFQHGRRRKRDLLRTLLRLWWSRWRHHVKTVLLILTLLLAFLLAKKRVWQRRWRLVAPNLQALVTVPVPFT